jgi:hypothetical protein
LHAVCSDGSDVNPEAGVVRLVLGVRVDLALNPLNRLAIELDIFGVGILQAGSTVAVASEPSVITIMILAVPSAGHIGIDIGATSLSDGQAQALAS